MPEANDSRGEVLSPLESRVLSPPRRDAPTPLVSVIIPTYNRSGLLRLTVESVLAQTYPNIETIVVDDGSTDDTAEVMKRFADQVTYVQREHVGSGGRNAGFAIASGEYISFLDHDDLFLPTKIERQVRILEIRPEVGLVHCGYYHMDRDGNFLDKVSFLPDGTLRELVCINQIWSGAPLIRRECVEEVGGFRKLWAADWDMWLRIALAGHGFACIREPLGAYRILPGSQMARVAELERGAFAALDEVFADPRVPSDVLAIKPEAYGNTHLWISWSYYASGRWEDAQRNLTEALNLIPRLRAQPQLVVDSLCGHALGVRITDPIRFVSGVLDHLPACANALRDHRAHLLANVHVGLALRGYARGSIEGAQHELLEAISLRPELLQEPQAFARLLRHHAAKLPVSAPDRYVESVLNSLPSGAQGLASVRPIVLSDVLVARAFEDYYARRWHEVAPRILTAARMRPAILKNRGALAIFVRSLAKQLSPARTSGSLRQE